MNEPIQEGVGYGGVPDELVPGGDGELAGNEDGAGVLAILNPVLILMGI
jgi:hypothetical protein